MKFTKYSLIALGAIAILTGCGGGGGSESDYEPPKESKEKVEFNRYGNGVSGTVPLESASDIPNTPSTIYQVTGVKANGCQFDIVNFNGLPGTASPNSPFLVDYGLTINDNLTALRCISDKVTIWYDEMANGTSVPFKRKKVLVNPDYDQSKVTKKSGDDPLYKYQWHLKNIGQRDYVVKPATSGNDINVEGVWNDKITGKGIKVAIIDEGVDAFHPDLNIDMKLSHNYHSKPENSHNTTPIRLLRIMDDPNTPEEEEIIGGYHDWPHGTAVAGIIGAKGWNGIGTRGVAPNSTIVSYNALEAIIYRNSSEARELYEKNKIEYIYHAYEMQHIRMLDALVRDLDQVHIYNNSWGSYIPTLSSYSDIYNLQGKHYSDQLQYGLAKGRSGKGAIYVKSGGNNSGSWTNFEPSQATGYFIVVGASGADGKVTSYSTRGPNILVNAPGGDSQYEFAKQYRQGIITTDMAGLKRGYDYDNTYLTKVPHIEAPGNENGDYTNRMSGTSASAPIVSGVVALMLEANPNLTYRDVRYILAHSAYKNDSSNSSWHKNGAGLYYSYDYGFGRVDAKKAVNMSKNFSSLGGFYERRIGKGKNQSTTKKSNSNFVSKLKIDKNIKTENVRISLTLDQNSTTEYETHSFSGSGSRETAPFILYSGKNIFNVSSTIANGSADYTKVKLMSNDIDADPEDAEDIASLDGENTTPVKKIVALTDEKSGYYKLIIDSNATNWRVDIKTPIPKSQADDIKVTLVSPSNTKSLLATAPNGLDANETYFDAQLSSVEFMDENAKGEWTLEVKDIYDNTFNFISWSLEVTGH